jgi:hypothetical protein
MDLYLRRVIHLQAHDNYRVILKDGGDEIEIGSIGIQHAAGARSFWRWAIDTVVPMRGLEARARSRRLYATVSGGVGALLRGPGAAGRLS